MKPRITLAEATLENGTNLCLQEHDGRISLLIHGEQICGPATRAVEEEMVRLACAPFRPVRQPKLYFVGLGLGHAVAAATTALNQKKGSFIVAEPLGVLPEWHRQHLPESPIGDSRVSIVQACGPEPLARMGGELHAVLMHLDASPLAPDNRPWVEDRRWLAAAYEALQSGGLLAIGGSRPNLRLTRTLRRAGFEVVEHEVPASPQAKRSRLVPVWLARKGRYGQ